MAKETIRLNEEQLKERIKSVLREMYGENYREKTDYAWEAIETAIGDDGEKWKELAHNLLYWLDDNEAWHYAQINDYVSGEYGEEDEDYDEYDEDEDVYSYGDWKRDKTLKVKVGQYISKRVYDQLLNGMPPHLNRGGYFQPGEAYGEKEGKPTYQTYKLDRDKGLYKYVGLML
jgi:hypothetical protein